MGIFVQIIAFWKSLDPEMKKMFFELLKGIFSAQKGPAVGLGSFTASAEGQQFVDDAAACGCDRSEAEALVGKIQSVDTP